MQIRTDKGKKQMKNYEQMNLYITLTPEIKDQVLFFAYSENQARTYSEWLAENSGHNEPYQLETVAAQCTITSPFIISQMAQKLREGKEKESLIVHLREPSTISLDDLLIKSK